MIKIKHNFRVLHLQSCHMTNALGAMPEGFGGIPLTLGRWLFRTAHLDPQVSK